MVGFLVWLARILLSMEVMRGHDGQSSHLALEADCSISHKALEQWS